METITYKYDVYIYEKKGGIGLLLDGQHILSIINIVLQCDNGPVPKVYDAPRNIIIVYLEQLWTIYQ